MIEDQLQNLLLSPGQSRERLSKERLNFRPVNRIIEADTFGEVIFSTDESDPAQHLTTAMIAGRPFDDGKEPGFERSSSIEPGLSLKDFEVDGLERVLSLYRIARAAHQRPAVRLTVVIFQLRSEFRAIHLIG